MAPFQHLFLCRFDCSLCCWANPEAMCPRDFASLPQDIFFLDVEGNCTLAHLNSPYEGSVAPHFGYGVLSVTVIFMASWCKIPAFSSLSSYSTFLTLMFIIIVRCLFELPLGLWEQWPTMANSFYPWAVGFEDFLGGIYFRTFRMHEFAHDWQEASPVASAAHANRGNFGLK